MVENTLSWMDAVDGSGQRYVEFGLVNGERLRVTRRSTEWAKGDVIRIQIREESGHLRMGPEVPVAQLDVFLFAVGRISQV